MEKSGGDIMDEGDKGDKEDVQHNNKEDNNKEDNNEVSIVAVIP